MTGLIGRISTWRCMLYMPTCKLPMFDEVDEYLPLDWRLKRPFLMECTRVDVCVCEV